MNIRLKNIGIISDSSIDLNGLTVITGHNNSGKTTVGKVIYSLVDAVTNIEKKAIIDKYNYVIDQLENASKEFWCYAILKKNVDRIENECIRIFFSQDYRQNIEIGQIESFLRDLLVEIDLFSIEQEPYKEIVDNGLVNVLFRESISTSDFIEEKEKATIILRDALIEITKDPHLYNYTEQSINGTLSVEFDGQIQPAALENVFSKIEMTDGNKRCFDFEIFNDEIVHSEEPVFKWMPYQNTYFIDNPYIVGEPVFRRVTRYTTEKSYLAETHFLSHENKLKSLINRPNKKSVFEAGIIEERYKKIKDKIDDILPGDIVFTPKGQYYEHAGIRLKSSNLATGSKMFAILKLLLSKGEITERTILILDEPEAHLHPKWQNAFAEIMILLIKEVGCQILLTTHSPNFMLALEANMRKYGVTDMCNFYQTEHIENSVFINYKCVNDSLEDIYGDFVTYLSDMKAVRDSYL